MSTTQLSETEVRDWFEEHTNAQFTPFSDLGRFTAETAKDTEGDHITKIVYSADDQTYYHAGNPVDAITEHLSNPAH